MIIGQGNAGQTAAKELRKQCPGATIALVDPIRSQSSKSESTTARNHSSSSSLSSTSSPALFTKLHFFPDLATSIDPRARIVRLARSDSGPVNGNSRTKDVIELNYKHAALIATGAHGAPVPSQLIDKHAWPYVLELRPTMFPQISTFQQQYTNGLDRSGATEVERQCLHPAISRKTIIQAARKGNSVGILGGGWDAIDLAIACSQASALATGGSRRKRREGTGDTRPTLIYGAVGPLSHVLPQYLVSAVAKRLRSKRIHVQDRTLVRYVSFDDRATKKKLGVYTAKAYDVLDSQRTLLDFIVVAPEVRGLRGNAMLPTNRVPVHLQETSEGRPWYQNWSQFSVCNRPSEEPPMLMCYQEDGRIMVNAELCACSRVYAAGSVARSANAFSGDAQVTGGGVVDSAEAGEVAASNMSNHFYENVIFSFPSNDRNSNSGSGPSQLCVQVKDPFPIWRSDVLSYDKETFSSLSSVGISALCVGDCDAERFTTHGVWWTNQAAYQRFLRGHLFSSDQPENEARVMANGQVSKTSVYGIGVVYYLDRTGRIKGVMTWGLPFANKDDQKTLKEELVQQIKEILISEDNGGLSPGSSQSFSFLSEQTQNLVRIAFSDGQKHQMNKAADGNAAAEFPRPLHRYTPIWMSSLAFRNRHRQSASAPPGVLRGEELFAPSLHNTSSEKLSLPSKPVAGVGFSDPSNQAFQAALNMYEYQVWELKEAKWDENELKACPPKEDAIWIRKGYEERNMNMAEKRVEEFGAVLGGRRQSLGNKARSAQ